MIDADIAIQWCEDRLAEANPVVDADHNEGVRGGPHRGAVCSDLVGVPLPGVRQRTRSLCVGKPYRIGDLARRLPR